MIRLGDDPYRALAESLVEQVLGDSLDGAALRERTTQCEAVVRASIQHEMVKHQRLNSRSTTLGFSA